MKRCSVLAAVFLCAGMARAFVNTDSNRVLVVYNTAWTQDNDGDGVQDSEQVMLHYVDRRAIPTNHVLGVSTRTQYYYDTNEHFYDQLVVPVKDKLDELGPANIDVILLIYGVPYRTPSTSSYSSTICVDNALMNLNRISRDSAPYGRRTNPYRETTPTFSSDKAHFDHALYKYSGDDVYMVCRLSAPDAPWGPINLIEQARYGEKYLSAAGWHGNVYVDSRHGPYTDAELTVDTDVVYGSYSSYGAGDKNMAYAEHYVTNLPLCWENLGTDKEIGESGAAYTVATNALFYGGWYNYGRYLDVFDWLPGSAGCDLNSNSAQGLRSGSAWIGGAFRQGLTCAAGVIGEPYLDGHQRPNVFLYYLLQGYTFAEAANLSTPYMEWQCTNLGDPLYAPFAPKAAAADTQMPVLSAGYPQAADIGQDGAAILFRIEESADEPEVVSCRVEWGLTPALGQVDDSLKGSWVCNEFDLSGLPSGTTCWYRVVIEDPAGHSVTSSVASFETLNAAPSAGFSVNAATGTVPFVVEFDGSMSADVDGRVVSWSWDFGDGVAGQGEVVQHTYTNPGIVTAELTVTDDDGAQDFIDMSLRFEPASGSMFLLQDGLDGYTNAADTYITCYNSSYTNRNYGGSASARTFSGRRRALFRFELPELSEFDDVVRAELRLFASAKNYGGSSDYMAAYCVTQAWVEGSGNGSSEGAGATWDDADRGTPWAAGSGGAFDTAPLDEVNYPDFTAPGWLVFDVTDQVAAWAAGDDNFGVLVKPRDDDCLADIRTREHATQAERPMLLILTEPATTAQGTPYSWLDTFYHGQSNQFETLDLADTDGDGFSARQEYIAGTSPTDGDDWFRIVSVSNRTVFFQSLENRQYTLLWKTNLADAVWITNETRLGVGGQDSMSCTNDAVQGFYKLEVEVP